jgi:hypothetical protein
MQMNAQATKLQAAAEIARPASSPEVQVGRRFRRTWRFRLLHLAFWLLLSFARDALVHL